MTQASLHDALAPLQRMVESEAVWDLPEYIHLTPPAWLVVPQVVAAAIAGLILLAWVQSTSGADMWLPPALIAVIWAVRHARSRRLSWPLGEGGLKSDQGRGCRVDLRARQVKTLGCEPEHQWQLNPALEWSLGCIAFADKSRRCYGWRIELRHVRKGPVMVLCTVLHEGHAVQDQEALHALVQQMAARLGIRRSGIGINTAPQS